MINRACVVGLGYIGLPTAAVLATTEVSVVGVDINPDVLDVLRRGELHIEEPDLQQLVSRGRASGRLEFRDCPCQADVFILCVQTPLSEDRSADLRALVAAARSIIPVLQAGNLVILESTIPPGTTRDVVAPILRESGLSDTDVEAGFHLVHCPERVIPGKIMSEIVANDRILGGITPDASLRAEEFYRRFVKGSLHRTDATTAEVVKLMENTFRDVNIALANELSNLSDTYRVNAWDVIEYANHHPRVTLHRPGPGVGGHCLSIDPWFLVEKAPNTARLIRLAREINNAQPGIVVNKAMTMLAEVADPVVAMLGLAFKGNVDDVRESPAMVIRDGLQNAGCTVRAVDPHLDLGQHDAVDLCTAFAGADLVVLVTDHREFFELDPHRLGETMRTKRLFDTRNILNHEQWRQAGYQVSVLGDGCGLTGGALVEEA